MKKILAIIQRDVKNGMRDWLIVYLTLAPFLIALILRLFIPATQNGFFSIAVLENDPLEALMASYAKVETFKTESDMIERINRNDDIMGILSKPNHQYEIIKQGNEAMDYTSFLEPLLYNGIITDSQFDHYIQISNIDFTMSPLKLQGGILIMLFSTVFGGMFIVLNMVDEKMSNTIKALNVTPASRFQVVIGKGFIGFLLPIIGALGAAWILGFSGIAYGVFLLTIIATALISLIIGFVIGILNDEPIAAVASMKIVFVPVLLSVFGAMFLSEKWQPLLYWSPYYWSYKSLHDILMQQAQIETILLNALWILLITVLVFLGLKKKIREGFQ